MKDWIKQNKVPFIITLTLVLTIFTVCILYSLFGHQVIQAMYEGRSIGGLNKVFDSKADHPLEFYLNMGDNCIYPLTIIGLIFSTWLFVILAFIKDKIFKKYLLVYLVFGTLLFFVRLGRVVEGYNMLDNVFYGTALAPNLYRVLVPWLSFLLKSIVPKLSWLNSARMWNFIFILSVFPLFHKYLSKWFERNICFLITILLGCLLPISFFCNYHEDFLELGVFILGYMFIRDKKVFFLCALIFLGTLSREATGLLVISYFISNINKKEFLKVSIKSFIVFIFWLISFISLRLIRGLRADRDELFYLGINLTKVKTAFMLVGKFRIFDLLFFLFPFVFIYIVFKQTKTNIFLRKNIITSAIFFVVMLNLAGIDEIRVFYPILPILVPLAFYPLFGNENRIEHL